MEDILLIEKYFKLTEQQRDQLLALGPLYQEWNSKINLISRKDIDQLYPHHILHSLGILEMIRFKADTQLLDFGTGGGFPGIPLAILLPDCQFTLVDSIGKKVRVAETIAREIGLRNVETLHQRAESIDRQFDFVVSRAVMQLGELVKYSQKLIHKEQRNSLPNGLIVLKGGNLEAELRPYKKIALSIDLYPKFDEPYFEGKKVIYLPL